MTHSDGGERAEDDAEGKEGEDRATRRVRSANAHANQEAAEGAVKSADGMTAEASVAR